MPLPLPYTITAGNLADANEVQSNFAAIAAKFNAGIDNADIAANANIDAAKLLDASITAPKIYTGAVTQAKLEDSTSASTGVSTAKIVDGSVTTAKLANSTGLLDGVTTAKIADLAVTSGKIAVNAAGQALARDGGAIAGQIKATPFSFTFPNGPWAPTASDGTKFYTTGLPVSGGSRVLPFALCLERDLGSGTSPIPTHTDNWGNDWDVRLVHNTNVASGMYYLELINLTNQVNIPTGLTAKFYYIMAA